MHGRSKKGFTLIELLAVIAIIGILAALSVVGIGNALKRARDAQRKRDLQNVKSALEYYYQDNNGFPTASSFAALQSPLSPYIKNFPADPTNTSTYVYTYSGTTSDFLLQAELEYAKDRVTINDSTVNCSSTSGTKANGVTSENGQSTGARRCFRLTND